MERIRQEITEFSVPSNRFYNKEIIIKAFQFFKSTFVPNK